VYPGSPTRTYLESSGHQVRFYEKGSRGIAALVLLLGDIMLNAPQQQSDSCNAAATRF
jgi:hypothetical protein